MKHYSEAIAFSGISTDLFTAYAGMKCRGYNVPIAYAQAMLRPRVVANDEDWGDAAFAYNERTANVTREALCDAGAVKVSQIIN